MPVHPASSASHRNYEILIAYVVLSIASAFVSACACLTVLLQWHALPVETPYVAATGQTRSPSRWT